MKNGTGIYRRETLSHCKNQFDDKNIFVRKKIPAALCCPWPAPPVVLSAFSPDGGKDGNDEDKDEDWTAW